MITVDILNEQTEPLTEEHLKLIETCIRTAGEMEEIEGEVVVTLVDDERIHELNLQYRQVDRPTDVLSFALTETGEDEPDIFFDGEDVDQMADALGDIVISIPRTIAQAREYGHSFERELGFLTVHGFLHLIGYDHGTPEEEQEMFQRQEEILAKVGLTR
jgi:probable rRNA maturation factor